MRTFRSKTAIYVRGTTEAAATQAFEGKMRECGAINVELHGMERLNEAKPDWRVSYSYDQPKGRPLPGGIRGL